MITGVVLAGGKSSRYGRNKTLEVFQGERLIDRAVAMLRPQTETVLVIGGDLSPYYDVKATLLQDIVPHQGPLGGIYTALLFSPHEWIFVRAADMPFFVPDLFSYMARYVDERFDVIIPMWGDFYEPLLAFYSRRCVDAMARALQRQERQIVKVFKKLRVKSVNAGEWQKIDPEGLSFKNINTLEDMKEISWTWSKPNI